ncbi:MULTISPECIES: DUF2285 domain-containing protein [unclassified Sphingopyxis]|uniref:DUF2285 domain-containing protein n=1 Tax=unclassified Sphingopyxis TaxID=2614943 RepID=UPI0024AE5D3E|nr:MULTISPECIES: DUF2285 domain-containing protein [unclassified Sphingopyxis]
MPRPQQREAPTGLAAFDGSPAVGGWFFAFDPDLTAAAAPALWRPQACAFVTIARPAPKGFAALRLAEIIEGPEIVAELLSYRDWHVVLRAGGRRYRLLIRRCLANERLAFLSPADAHIELRASMIMALHRELLDLGGARPPPDATLGPTERWRLIQWIRLLDAMAEGISAREIAARLLLEDARSYSAAEWDASSERRRIARWQRAALAMRDGGLSALLGTA